MSMEGSTAARNGIWQVIRGTGSTPLLLAIFMITLAFNAGVRRTYDLTWPPYMDHARDASFAQSVLDGHYGEDPLYNGESMWFTPMLFTLEAYAVDLTGVDLQVIQARAGAYWNLLAPIAFFMLAWRWFGSSVAVVALAAYLFVLPGQEPGWAVATYSPLFLAMNFAQGLFFLMLLVLFRAFKSVSWVVWAAVGLGAGLLFLSHAAPAILIVAMIAIHIIRRAIAAWRISDGPQAGRYLLCGVAAAATFILVSLPLIWYVVGDYMLDQKDRIPTAFTYEPLSLRHVDRFLYHNVTLFVAFGIMGLFFLYRGKRSTQRTLMIMWVGLTTILALYAYLAMELGLNYGIYLPTSVPAFHFYSYLKVALAMGLGIAVVRMLQWAMERYYGERPAEFEQDRLAATTAGLVVIGTLAMHPTNANRPDLFNTRMFSIDRMADTDATDMYATLRDKLPWEAVVLCDDELSLWILMASARKTVATNASMANPYVLPAPREAARARLLEALERPDADAGKVLDEYHVTHVLIRVTDIDRMPELAHWFPKPLHANGTYALYARQVRPAMAGSRTVHWGLPGR